METIDPKPRPLTVDEVAAELGCSVRTVRRLARSGAISHMRVGQRGLIRIDPAALASYKERITVAAATI